jgi:cbb3-type cytochrome oxidase subunit 3
MMGNEVIFIVSVIALIFYLVISKFLKNNIKDNYFRIFIGLIISIMFGIIFYVFSVAGLIYFLTKEKSRDFDKKDWILLNEDIEKRLHRYEMIDDLIDSRVLIDKDSIQVKELLGKPNYKNTNENVWTYEAGTGGGFGFVDHFLEIYYKKNKVQKIEHKRIQD